MPDRQFEISKKTTYESVKDWPLKYGWHILSGDIVKNLYELVGNVEWDLVVNLIQVMNYGTLRMGGSALNFLVSQSAVPVIKATRWSMHTPQMVYSTSYAVLRHLRDKQLKMETMENGYPVFQTRDDRLREFLTRSDHMSQLTCAIFGLGHALEDYTQESLKVKNRDYLHALQVLYFATGTGSKSHDKERNKIFVSLRARAGGSLAKHRMLLLPSVQGAVDRIPFDFHLTEQ